MAFRETTTEDLSLQMGKVKDFGECDSFEQEFISGLVDKNPHISGREINEITKVNSNYFYDSYCIDLEQEKRILKVSYITGENFLQTEHNALNALPSVSGFGLIGPTSEYHDTTSEYSCLFTSFEHGYTFEDLPKTDFVYNLSTFCHTLDAMHSAPTGNLPSYKDKINLDASITSFLFSLEDAPSLDLMFTEKIGISFWEIQDLISFNKRYLDAHYKPYREVFANTNLKYSSILHKEGMMKFVNFDQVYCLDLFLSLNITAVNLAMNASNELERRFLQKYYENSELVSGFDSRKDFLNQYYDNKESNAIFIFSDLLSKQIFSILTEGYADVQSYSRNLEIYKYLKPYLTKTYPDCMKSLNNLFYFFHPTYAG